ncbi:hypothetical protein ccbrp13_10290 [Ktedonobacteria bacterium brp13]|nr:hypothetical protein ccbrp13_10290 [Ktedonobacteria bacterium brp13]
MQLQLFGLNTAHIHLLLNHFPILGSIIITGLFIVALIFRNTFLQKVSLWFLAGIAVITAITFQTGSGAEQAVLSLNMPQVVSLSALQSHKQMADVGLVLMFFTGAISLGSAVFYRNKPALPRPLLVLMLVILLVNVGVFTYVSYLGGMIMHPEIRTFVATTLHYL